MGVGGHTKLFTHTLCNLQIAVGGEKHPDQGFRCAVDVLTHKGNSAISIFSDLTEKGVNALCKSGGGLKMYTHIHMLKG